METLAILLLDAEGNQLNPHTDIDNVEGLSELIPSEANSENQLADKSYVDSLSVSVVNMTTTSASILPNTFYVWGEISTLDITLETPSNDEKYNEYMFLFTSGDTATTLSLPDSITWYLEINTVLPNKTYQISIVNNLAILAEF